MNPRLLVEEGFALWIKLDETDLADVTIVAASDRSAVVPPLHVFVLVRELDRRTPTHYIATVAVALVSNIDDTTEATRAAIMARIWAKLISPQPFVVDNLTVMNWSVPKAREVAVDQESGDVYEFVAAVEVG